MNNTPVLDIPAGDDKSSGPTEGLHIMTVDDNPANLQLIGELLKDLRCRVTRANSGSEALSLCEQQKFDLIFMDIQMPIMDGLETTRRLRALEKTARRTPIIALTADTVSERKAELLLAGLDDYLSKPISEAQLVHVIRRWIHRDTASTIHSIVSTAANTSLPLKTSLTNAPVNIQLSLQLSNSKPVLARDMLRMLLDQLPEDQRKIEQLFQDRAFADLEAVVHKLNGGASYCGVPHLKSTAASLEKLLQSHSYDNLDSAVAELLSIIEQLLDWESKHDLDVLFGLEVVDV
jgi:two-component system, NarL family, sensor histidine kinase BarA